jgi:arabinogalactan oligomer/maltooligosaccharide transport system permease protein
MKTRRIIGDVIVYIILTVMSFLWLIPIVWIFLQSFSGEPGSVSATEWWPSQWSFNPYIFLFTNQAQLADGTIQPSMYNFWGYVGDGTNQTTAGVFYPGSFLNTFWLAIVTAIISTLFCLATAYAFSRLRFKGRTGMMKFILVLGMFPSFLSMIVLYWIFKQMGLGQSIWALVIIYSGGAGMGYYISKGFFDTISKQIDEAAMVDGASRFQIFYKITLPLSKPILIYTALTSFMGPWAEYITASYILGGQVPTKSNWTVAITLWTMLNNSDLSSRGPYWTQFAAGSVIIAIPVCLLFITMQRYYVSGVTGGAVKG